MKLGHIVFFIYVTAIVLGFTTPKEVLWLERTIWFFGDVFSQYLSYLSRPLLFFSMVVSVVYLKRRCMLSRVMLRAFIGGIIISLFLVILGVLIVYIVPLPRLTILFEQNSLSEKIAASQVVSRLFPSSLTGVFLDFWFLPLFFLALVFGLNMDFDMESIEPVFNLFDSFSRIFFHIINKALYLIFIPIFFLILKFIRTLRFDETISYYKPLLLLVLIVLVSVIVINSIIYYFITEKKGFFYWIYGVMTSIIFVLLSGHLQAGYSLYSVQSHNNQNIKRDIAGFNVPFFMLFVRSGTAFVVSVSLMLIIKSYSMLEISFVNILHVIFAALFSSVFLPISEYQTMLQQSLHFSLSMYPSNIDSGLRTLEPIIPHLAKLAGVMDLMILAFLLRIFAHQYDFLRSDNYI